MAMFVFMVMMIMAVIMSMVVVRMSMRIFVAVGHNTEIPWRLIEGYGGGLVFSFNLITLILALFDKKSTGQMRNLARKKQ